MPLSWEQALSFALAAGAIVASPGPDTLLIVRNAAAWGRRAGLQTLAGVQAGVSAHTALAAGGLSALLYFSETLFRLLALAGACYLGWLGWRTVFPGQSAAALRAPAAGGFFRQGVLCNLLNPKVLILFVALLPGFVDHEAGGQALQIAALGAILLAINIPFQAMIMLLAGRAGGRMLGGGRLGRWILGGILMFFGIALFVEHVAP